MEGGMNEGDEGRRAGEGGTEKRDGEEGMGGRLE